MSPERERFRVLTAGECAPARPLFEHDALAQRFELHSMPLSGDIFAGIDRFHPDLILIDADGVDFSGLELCRALKVHPATLLVPVVAVGSSSSLQRAAYSAGADDYLGQPLPDDLLVVRLTALARAGALRRATTRPGRVLQHEQLQAAFRRYVPPQLADRILEDSPWPGVPAAGHVQTRAVVLFADLRGFTGIAERLRPHEVVPLLNEYFSLLTEITFQHEGTVFHMAGDSLMVAFGVPREQSDSRERALQAAHEMLARFADLARDWQMRLNILTGLGIGINEGEVIAGNIGSAMFMNYTIIGDAVNVASRLCQRARAGEIVLSRALKGALDARGLSIGAIELPAMEVRGRSAPIDICCVPMPTRLVVAGAPAAEAV